MTPPLRVWILASGGWTTMREIILRSDKLGIQTAVVITDRICGAIERARAHKIPTYVVEKSQFGIELWAQQIREILERYDVDIVSQNGWTPLTPIEIINHVGKGNIINQHPGALSGNGAPDFGGKGMCGTPVTAATLLHHLESNEEDPERLITQSTVHAVTAWLDEGALIRLVDHNIAHIVTECRGIWIRTIADAQAKRGEFDDLVEVVKAGLLPVEHDNVAEVLRQKALGIFPSVEKNPMIMNLNPDILARVKRAAIEMYPTK